MRIVKEDLTGCINWTASGGLMHKAGHKPGRKEKDNV